MTINERLYLMKQQFRYTDESTYEVLQIAYYHTPFDTIDKIEPKAVKSVIDLAVNYILYLDSTTTIKL